MLAQAVVRDRGGYACLGRASTVPWSWASRVVYPTWVGMDPEQVLQHLLKSAQWTASRSSGPGGQHRDKASTRAELTLAQDSLVGLEPEIADRLAAALGVEDQPLRIVVQDERSLSRNREIAIKRLAELIGEALSPPAPQRRPTRPGRASRERRLAEKVRRGHDKILRSPPHDADWQ
jgi:ribosome-associated protein